MGTRRFCDSLEEATRADASQQERRSTQTGPARNVKLSWLNTGQIYRQLTHLVPFNQL